MIAAEGGDALWDISRDSAGYFRCGDDCVQVGSVVAEGSSTLEEGGCVLGGP